MLAVIAQKLSGLGQEVWSVENWRTAGDVLISILMKCRHKVRTSSSSSDPHPPLLPATSTTVPHPTSTLPPCHFVLTLNSSRLLSPVRVQLRPQKLPSASSVHLPMPTAVRQ